MADKPFDKARPLYSLPLGDETYELVGTFALIEAVEHALGRSFIAVATEVVDMGVSDTAKLLSAMLNASGEKTTARIMGEKLWAIGMDTPEFASLKIHLYAFLRILLARPDDRKEVSEAMGEMTGKLQEASRGKTTSASA